QAACEARDGWGCHLLGLAYYEGLGCDKDPAQALEAFRQACARQGDKNSCKLKGKAQKLVDKQKD
ncbi:MAG: SEL1-like repeat protein, partial [Proteobacteria bacterium]|nr:SEL1-like repeat protein [Pseudomonadota bacterium]